MHLLRHSQLGAALLVAALWILGSSAALAADAKTYGEGIGAGTPVKISELYSTPDPHLGKTVRIEGRVVGVCEHRGCWIELASDREFESMIVKVEDGVITFPVEATGKWAVAEGTFAKIELDMEQTRKYEEHQCQEEGRKFDPALVTEPKVLYRLQGIGAVISDQAPAPSPATGDPAS